MATHKAKGKSRGGEAVAKPPTSRGGSVPAGVPTPLPQSWSRLVASSGAVPVGTLRGDCAPLKPGDIIRMNDATLHFVQYVNTSGAYAVPLAGVEREIKGNVVSFSAGGRSISVTSLVEHLTLDELRAAIGESSPQFKRCVIMAKSKSGKGGKGGNGNGKAKVSGSKADVRKAAAEVEAAGGAASLGDFDSTPISEQEQEQGAGESEGADSAAADSAQIEDEGMAKAKANGTAKSKAAKVKKVKKVAAPKTVRSCVCGCGNQTSGYFAPGHDARYHGFVKRLADGRMEPKDIPAALRSKMTLVQTKTGFTAKTPEFYKS